MNYQAFEHTQTHKQRVIWNLVFLLLLFVEFLIIIKYHTSQM